jgi:hypothetical protein
MKRQDKFSTVNKEVCLVCVRETSSGSKGTINKKT